MITRIYSVAFEGVEARLVEIQCAVTPGLPSFSIVGLADKAVSEARERVRAALTSLGIALPSRRITVNLSPADLPKEGAHFDLPIALALLAALEIFPADMIEDAMAMGELSLDAKLIHVAGALPAAMAAQMEELSLYCPSSCGAEAAWLEGLAIYATNDLIGLINHFKGRVLLPIAQPKELRAEEIALDMRDVKGQGHVKRALEVAAAGRHHVFMTGPPGSGKSMLAARLPTLLPPLTAPEALETSMIHSLAGVLQGGGISRVSPFRDPHHTASMAAIVGGGRRAAPGEISLAHNGVLFLDELPEFSKPVLETLRQPLETGRVMIARANAHVSYPCRFMLIGASNPCRCGHLGDPEHACTRAPLCGQEYWGRISGPLMDRFDLRIEVGRVSLFELRGAPEGEGSEAMRARVTQARARQEARYAAFPHLHQNADLEGQALERFASPDAKGYALLEKAVARFSMSARGYHRVLRAARSIADLDGAEAVQHVHIAEALSYRIFSDRG